MRASLMPGSVLNEYRHQLIYSSQFYEVNAISIPILDEESKAQRD